jgi:hypothetical protein
MDFQITDWCCDENCKILGLDEEHWKPFKSLCSADYDYHGCILTKENFEDRYNGVWYDLGKFAKDLCEDCYGDSLNDLPLFINRYIDWDKVWEEISIDYVVYDNYVFSND